MVATYMGMASLPLSSSLCSPSISIPRAFRLQACPPFALSSSSSRFRPVFAQISDVPSSNDEPAAGTQASQASLVRRARLRAQATESRVITEVQQPLAEYMSLPASQYSVLDAERIERVDDNTFRCYIYRLKFFNFEVCPVLMVRVDELPDGCCIRLLSCTLEGSPQVMAQNKKFSASMINRVSWSYSNQSSSSRCLNSDTTIEVVLDIPFPFRAIPVDMIENTGSQVLRQLLRVMLPRFLAQLEKDYLAWASGDSSRRPLGSGEL